MTPEEQAQYDAIVAERDQVRQELEAQKISLSQEAANYRTQRSDALKRAHVLEAVLKGHNVSVDTSGIPTDHLKVEDGKVIGDVQYTPPKFNHPQQTTPPIQNSNPPLTLEAIKSMSVKDIEANFDQVMAVVAPQS